MKLNRRNVLVGLGGIVASGGALLGTGAFSQVQASREVTISTTDDSSAIVTLTASAGAGEYVDETSDAIVLDIQNLNTNATTTIDPIVDIEVPDSNVTVDSISVSVDDPGTGSDTDILTILDGGLTDSPYSFGLEIDFENYVEGDLSSDPSITIDVQASSS